MYKLMFRSCFNNDWQLSKDNNHFETKEQAIKEATKRVNKMLKEFDEANSYKIIEVKE